MIPPGYYQPANGPMVTHALGYMMYGYTLLAPINQRVLNKSSKKHIYMCVCVCVCVFLVCVCIMNNVSG